MSQEERNQHIKMANQAFKFSTRGSETTFQSQPGTSKMDADAAAKREDAFNSGAKSKRKPSVDSFASVGVPLDYSYSDIKDIKDLPTVEPNSGKVRPHGTEVKPGKSRHINTGLKLGYNELTSLGGMMEAIKAVMDPVDLTMLDLSHNQFNLIPPELAQLPNLAVLYLHGNRITDIKEVRKLRKLKNLQKLTLHGNAVFYGIKDKMDGQVQGRRAIQLEETPHYRPQVIYVLRETLLKSLDQTPLTPKDRENALVWYKNHRE